VKDRIGYLPEERGVYRRMRVGAFLRYVAQLKGLRGPSLKPGDSRLDRRMMLEFPDVVEVRQPGGVDSCSRRRDAVRPVLLMSSTARPEVDDDQETRRKDGVGA
jgi:ABC-type Na+ transport system ATPase subunit NatA